MNFERLWKLIAGDKNSVPVTEMKTKIRECQEMDSWTEAAQVNKAIWANISMNFIGIVHLLVNAIHLPWFTESSTAFGEFIVLIKVQMVTLVLLYTEIQNIISKVENNKAVLRDFGSMYSALPAHDLQ